jgi:endonuclease G
MQKTWMCLLALPLLVWANSRDDQRINRTFYRMSYNGTHAVANWVDYSLEISQLKRCASRTNIFLPDPLVTYGATTLSDYYQSQFDRGHLLPAGDMKFDLEAMKETFYLSNITPQPSKFNSGKWGTLENLVRAWALKYKKVWIVTGPVLNNHLAKIGVNHRLSVPEEFYKVLIRKTQNSYTGIGFIMPTNVPFPNLAAYAVSIDAVEHLTNLDFFSYLEDSAEAEIENQTDFKDWDFGAKFDYLPCS